MIHLVALLALLILLAAAVFVRAALQRKMQYWVPSYCVWVVGRGLARRGSGPKDVLFCVANHFEPGHRRASVEVQRERVRAWSERFPAIASEHGDADGVPPRHTWFFPPHYDHEDFLERLAHLSRQGYGEVEMHMHHDHLEPFPEVGDSLDRKVKECIERFGRCGVFPVDPETGEKRFAFVHGDWALDNSRGGMYCGVNDEISRLVRLGCYADLTFPSLHEAQPRKINSIYYAVDDRLRPKSYDTGRDVVAGARGTGWFSFAEFGRRRKRCLSPSRHSAGARDAVAGARGSGSFSFAEFGRRRKRCLSPSRHSASGLLMIEGPIGFVWRRGRLRPSVECAEVSRTNPPLPERIDFWVHCGIHVLGRPNWVFVKVHCHGCADESREVLLGEHAGKLYEYLETTYNDGRKYRLHYVAAREMYNIIRAAEAGLDGDPNEFRDYHLPPPPGVGGVRDEG